MNPKHYYREVIANCFRATLVHTLANTAAIQLYATPRAGVATRTVQEKIGFEPPQSGVEIRNKRLSDTLIDKKGSNVV